MSSVVETVLKAATGLLVYKGKDKEAKKLNKGDPTDHNFCDFIVSEIDDIKSKVNELEGREDLGMSITFFKEGVMCLFKLFNKTYSSKVGSESAQTSTRMQDATSQSQVSLAEGLSKFQLPDLNDADKRVLLEAKEGFKSAIPIAAKASGNEALCTSDRIQAMVVRIAATILEKIDHPIDAQAAYRLCLEELHSMPAVQNSFTVALKEGGLEDQSTEDESREIVSTVCHVNRVIYDVTLVVDGCVELLNWPCIDNVKEYIDPLRDIRVTKVNSCSISWSFGQEDEEAHNLKSPRGIATNQHRQFIVGDKDDRNVKVFDNKGTFVKSLSPSSGDMNSNLDIQNVTTDKSGNIYALIRRELPRGETYAVYLSDGTADLYYKFALRERFKGWNLAVNDRGKVLVLGRKIGTELVEVYDTHGQFVVSFGEERIKHAEGITTANDGRVMIVGTYYSFVYVFSEQGEKLFKFNLKVERYYLSLDVAFHWESGRVLVAGKEEGKENLRVLVYTKDGKFEREIQHDGKWVSSFAGITVTMEGRIAAVVYSKVPGGLSKVVVL